MPETDHGKKAEKKIKEWLDRPSDDYDFTRIPDQMTGYYMVSRNICDFDCYKYPHMYHIESKATYEDRFEFHNLTDLQRDGLLLKSQLPGVYGFVIVLYVSYKRAFVFDIRDIAEFIEPELSLNELNHRMFSTGSDHEVISRLKLKSLNINKIEKWSIPYKEIRTIPNNRKEFLDYEGEIEEYIPERDNL